MKKLIIKSKTAMQVMLLAWVPIFIILIGTPMPDLTEAYGKYATLVGIICFGPPMLHCFFMIMEVLYKLED